ncbi:MAG TPA: AMP-binding protein [Caulobacteraceae bacterium]|jgi:bile acid-coenzyme A ligase|nr:AMP-binding protein [Caulobacteraceae bacterium]
MSDTPEPPPLLYDPALSFGARLSQIAAEKPDAPALTDASQTLTWAEFDRRTNRIARGLAKAGVTFGDVVSIALPNTSAYLEVAFGLWKAGATPQMLSYRLPKHEADAVLDLAGAPILVTDGSVESSRPNFSAEALYELGEDDGPLPDVTAPVFKAATSGGSTGRPKLIMSGLPGLAIATGGPVYRIGPDDTCVIPGPLYHNAPFVCSSNALTQGAHVVLMPRFDAEETLRNVDAHKATWLYVVPTMMSRIWKLPEAVKANYDVSSLHTVWHMAAPCPPWLKEAWIDWIGPDAIMELYAGTEAQSATIITGREWLAHRGSVGQVRAGEMATFNEAGERLPLGEIGEIYLRRPEGSPPSYQYRGATARTLPGGWESLGDIGYFDADGYLYLADRRTDMILVGGGNVYPAEIEAALDEHPNVQSSAVVGLPDEDMGNTLHAIVQPKGDLTEAELREHLRALLVPYKQPRSYEFVAENIRDDAGKVRRTALRDERIARMRSGLA